jgi:UDP-N-acetyl-D-mannosaminuronic acid dehydrogenase
VDQNLVPLEKVLAEADLLIVATPHPEYRSIRTDKPVADVWNVLGKDVAA